MVGKDLAKCKIPRRSERVEGSGEADRSGPGAALWGKEPPKLCPGRTFTFPMTRIPSGQFQEPVHAEHDILHGLEIAEGDFGSDPAIVADLDQALWTAAQSISFPSPRR